MAGKKKTEGKKVFVDPKYQTKNQKEKNGGSDYFDEKYLTQKQKAHIHK